MRYGYTPFTKSLEEISGDDLVCLRDIYEGWFIDYKSQAISPRDYAKHLSGFANQHGGWMFVGVDEGRPKTMKAATFPGIPKAEVERVLVDIREAVAAHASPEVFFESKVIGGPCPSLSLPDDRAIVIVGVPEGANPPYVHSSGRIYRRVADESDPKAETDRLVLDHLWERGHQAAHKLRNFIGSEPTSYSREGALAHCYAYFLPDPHFCGRDVGLGFTDFRDIMTTPGLGGTFGVTLDNVFVTSDRTG